MNRNTGGCLSALGLVTLIVLCTTLHRSPIEQHLKEQSKATLTRAGLTGWDVSFDGLDAQLFGPAADADKARALVAQVPGVATVTMLGAKGATEVKSTPTPALKASAAPKAAPIHPATSTASPTSTPAASASPVPTAIMAGEPTGLVQVLSYEGIVYLRGVYPDEVSRQSALQAARAAFGESMIRDETTLSGTGEKLGWPEEVLKSLSALKSVQGLELSAGGDVLQLNGTVDSAAEKARLAKRIQASLPATVTLENRLTLAGEKLPLVLPTALAALPTSERQKAQQQLNGVVSGGEVLFATASSRIRPETYPYLNSIAATLKKQTTATVIVGGHTDNEGAEPDNLRLSQKRADAVRAYLIARGVPVKHLFAQGLGSSVPIASNTTEPGRRRNRRIGFVVR